MNGMHASGQMLGNRRCSRKDGVHRTITADMILYEVFLRHGMDPAAEGGMDLYGALWDQAWNLAEGRDFRIAG